MKEKWEMDEKGAENKKREREIVLLERKRES